MIKQESMATEKTNVEPQPVQSDGGGGGGGSRVTGLRYRAARAIRNITVEPLLGLYQLSTILSSLTTQNLNLQKACRVNMGLDDSVCSALENKNATALYRQEELDVQHTVAGMMVWQNVIQNAFPCALVVFVGSWSDRNRRRKPFMLIPILGELVRNLGLIACVHFFFELPMEVAGLVESIPSSVTGSLPVLFLAVFAYVGDISTVNPVTRGYAAGTGTVTKRTDSGTGSSEYVEPQPKS